MGLTLNSFNNPVQNVTNFVDNVVNQYIVKPLGGKQTIGISGFIFDIIDTEEVLLESEITDHYVEDNYAIQDHITIKPIRFTLKGYVGELNDIFSNSFLSVLTNIQSIGTVGGLLPEFSAQATQVYAKVAASASKVGNVLNQAQNLFDLFTGKSTTNNEQQKAYKFFQDMWISRQLCTVETPFRVFENMAIERVAITQTGTTKFVSEFSVSFKEIKVANTLIVKKTVTGMDGLSSIYENNDPINSILGNGRAADTMSDFSYKGQTAGNTIDADGSAVSIDKVLTNNFTPGGGGW